jgi:hypothetical protein
MMNRRVAALLLVASVVAGAGVGAAVHAATSEQPARTAAPAVSSTPTPAKKGVEVKDPVLVANDDGTATLSATIVNHTARALVVNNVTGGMPDDYDAPILLTFRGTPTKTIEPGVPLTIGRATDAYRFRFRDRVQIGSTLPITLTFLKARHPADPVEVTFTAAVVKRTAVHRAVANNGPNSDIAVRDGIIVVVPGQTKAYIDGWIDSTVDDMTEIRPTGELRSGRTVEILHQTATGGPSGVFAQAGEPVRLGYTPYLDDGLPGDRDYVEADEVEVGQTVTVTMRFPSGDVVSRFKVVQGKADGTI